LECCRDAGAFLYTEDNMTEAQVQFETKQWLKESFPTLKIDLLNEENPSYSCILCLMADCLQRATNGACPEQVLMLNVEYEERNAVHSS
jgi:hypothetical protein